MGSAVTREADGVLYTRAGLEIGVAATKTFTAQIALMTLLALRLAQLRWQLSPERVAEIAAALEELPSLVQAVLDDEALQADVSAIAERFARDRFFLYLGRHLGMPICLEGALKLKEICYIPTDAYAAGEMKHGPIALLGAGHARRRGRDRLARLREGRLEPAGGAGARRTRDRRRDRGQRGHPSPRRPRPLRAALARRSSSRSSPSMPLQLLAYRIARPRELDVDQPRNLAKTVTVE